tara:strand:- start:87 stop:365 length:279 start_codon:yes stop_codon:yes gene_type:complete
MTRQSKKCGECGHIKTVVKCDRCGCAFAEDMQKSEPGFVCIDIQRGPSTIKPRNWDLCKTCSDLFSTFLEGDAPKVQGMLGLEKPKITGIED